MFKMTKVDFLTDLLIVAVATVVFLFQDRLPQEELSIFLTAYGMVALGIIVLVTPTLLLQPLRRLR